MSPVLGLAPAAVLLIHFGAQLDVRDGEKLTPMHMAAGYANAQTLRVLVAAGADTNVTGLQQGTPLQVVLRLGEYQLEQFSTDQVHMLAWALSLTALPIFSPPPHVCH